MKRTLALALLMALVILPVLSATEAWARAGGGSSSGSRGSRSYSAPARPSQSPASPSQPSSPALSSPAQPQRPGWGGMMGGMLGGLLLGGLLGGLLFGGGFGGGFGLLELLIVAGLAWVAFSYLRRRQAARAPGYAMAGGMGSGPSARDDAAVAARYGATGGATATVEAPTGPTDLQRGLGHIRQMDPAFDPRAFAETASDIFFRVQGAWTARDLRSVAASLTPEMQSQLQRDCDRLRSEGRINRLENIAVRTAEVTEAWQEGGQDYVTVHFLASLLDYTTDESGARLLDGSRTEPVKFEEFWTFVRPVGPSAFRLTAIQQA
ncbi:MAG TPA: Tim44 domain-containing protein [Methylomirabilota bacterium]